MAPFNQSARSEKPMSNISTAFRQYANRPKDERFPDLQSMIDASLLDKNLSAERTYNLKDLKVVTTTYDTRQDAFSPKADVVGHDLALASPKGQATFSHWAFSQLARTLGAPASYLRERLSPELAAACLNHGLSTSPVGTTANLYVRGANGQPPMIRACTSETYGRLHDADLYGAINDYIVKPERTGQTWALPPTWSGEPAGAYRGDRDSFLILVNGGSIVTDPSLTNNRVIPVGQGGNGLLSTGSPDAGSMFRGLLIRNSEVGASAIVIESILYRYVCGNHMLWGAIVDRAFRRRHVGKSVLRDTVREIGTIARRWSDHSAAQDQAIIAGLISHEIAHTKEAVIDECRAMGFTAEQAANAYDRCERTESVSPRSFWGITQGLTRMSQDEPYQDGRYELDKLAAVVLARGAKLVAA
jgi:hypothetical protein